MRSTHLKILFLLSTLSFVVGCNEDDETGGGGGGAGASTTATTVASTTTSLTTPNGPQTSSSSGDNEAALRADAEAAFGEAWETDCLANPPDDQGNVTYFQSVISGQGDSGEFAFNVYGDDACSSPLFTIRNESNRSLGAHLPSIEEGVFELDIEFTKLFALPHAAPIVDLFNQAGCGPGNWVLGEEQEVSTQGCLFFEPISVCGADYDIFRRAGDQVYTGVRTENMCIKEGRPTELNAWSFHMVP